MTVSGYSKNGIKPGFKVLEDFMKVLFHVLNANDRVKYPTMKKVKQQLSKITKSAKGHYDRYLQKAAAGLIEDGDILHEDIEKIEAAA